MQRENDEATCLSQLSAIDDHVRPMRDEDAHAVWDITTRALGYSCSEEVVRGQIVKLASDPHYLNLVWTDETTGEVIAFLQATEYETLHSHGGWDIINLAVIPERQQQGIGKALLASFESIAKARGGQFVRLNSRLERTGAHAFYERAGYASSKTQRYFSKQL